MAGHSISILDPRLAPCLLTSLESLVTQAELNELSHRFHISHSISMRAPKIGELPLRPHKESGEIAFLTVVLECGVRLPLAPLVRKVLNEFPLYLLQVALAL